ncbi:MAG: hypothetical protein HYV09_26605 [Deltaproteobacteria bacterium]|nr:hypothetical protein [Deltaproteobacteria bacterium]
MNSLRSAPLASLASLGWVAALLVAACGGGKTQAAGPSSGWIKGLDGKKGSKAAEGTVVAVGDVPPDVSGITGRTLKLASKARQLKVKEPIKLQVLGAQQLVAVVRKKVGDDIPKDLVRAEGNTYAALGLIPPTYKYEEETYALLEEELAGLYIPEDKTMYVAAGITGADLESTLAHELVHALQDQHFGIGERMKFRPGQGDAIAAIHALAEGDATSAMFDARIISEHGEEAVKMKNATAIPDQDPEDLLAITLKDKAGKSRISAAPRFLAVGLLAPYADGMRFVHAMRRQGGPLGWRAVDQAWARPPISTEQLLHIDKYAANELPIEVPAATSNALGASFKKTYDDVFGEQEGRIAFAEWMDVKSSKKAAAGWGGDRVTLFEHGDKRAVSWRIVFDSRDESDEAYGLLAFGWAKSFGPPSLQLPVNEKGEQLQVWGAVPQPAAPKEPPPDPKAKKPAKGDKGKPESTLPPLPPLPDAPGAPAVKMDGCRALRQAGKSVTILGGVPCGSVVAWAAEVGKLP